ncbi:MAG: hypothetical protein AB1427_01855 [Thermodesulfobacteriota bacterium]
MKALTLCLLFGYLDYALEILEPLKHLFSEMEIAHISKIIKKVTLNQKLPSFRGRERLADFLLLLWKILRPTHGGWATKEQELGNL